MNIDPLHIAGLIGFFVVMAISVYFWERVLFRFVPFIYATVLAIVWFYSPSSSIIDLLKVIAALNVAAGVMVLSAWLQIRRRD
jgi:hypothetical protein